MISNEVGQQLHSRAARGLPITDSERAVLDQWYAEQDSQEAAILAQASPAPNVGELRAEVDRAVAQLKTAVTMSGSSGTFEGLD